MSDFLDATIPFIKDSKDYPLTLLYNSDDFLIASGKDGADKNKKCRSIGVRWHRSRSEGNKQNPLGFPNVRGFGCWFIIPNDLALCLLNHIKDLNECVNKDETNKAIKELTEKIKRRV